MICQYCGNSGENHKLSCPVIKPTFGVDMPKPEDKQPEGITLDLSRRPYVSQFYFGRGENVLITAVLYKASGENRPWIFDIFTKQRMPDGSERVSRDQFFQGGCFCGKCPSVTEEMAQEFYDAKLQGIQATWEFRVDVCQIGTDDPDQIEAAVQAAAIQFDGLDVKTLRQGQQKENPIQGVFDPVPIQGTQDPLFTIMEKMIKAGHKPSMAMTAEQIKMLPTPAREPCPHKPGELAFDCIECLKIQMAKKAKKHAEANPNPLNPFGSLTSGSSARPKNRLEGLN